MYFVVNMVDIVIEVLVVNVIMNEIVVNVMIKIFVILEGMVIVYGSLCLMVVILIFYGVVCFVKYYMD